MEQHSDTLVFVAPRPQHYERVAPGCFADLEEMGYGLEVKREVRKPKIRLLIGDELLQLFQVECLGTFVQPKDESRSVYVSFSVQNRCQFLHQSAVCSQQT
jgi:hypothetical protein